MNYFVVNLCECAIVAECDHYSTAFGLLIAAVEESYGFYTEDDFAIMNEEELENYGLRN